MKKLMSLKINTKKENIPQNNPATATVVNVGVFFLHLNETEKKEKPPLVLIDDNGKLEFWPEYPARTSNSSKYNPARNRMRVQ